MTCPSAMRTALALVLVALLGGTVLGQSNVPQTIRYGEVLSVEKTVIMVQPSNTGTQIGATAGAVAGYALADHGDRWLGGLLGGVLGGAAGRAADKGASKKKGWQLIIRLEETGEEIGVQVLGKKKKHNVGDRVRLLTGTSGRTEVSPV